MKSSGNKKQKTVIECSLKGIYIGLSVWLDITCCILITASVFAAALFWEETNPVMRDINTVSELIVAYQSALYINILQLSALVFFLYTVWKILNGTDNMIGVRPLSVFVIRLIIGSLMLSTLSFSYNKGETIIHDFLANGELFKVLITYFCISIVYSFIREVFKSSSRNDYSKIITVMDYIKSLNDDTLITFIDGDIHAGAYTVKEVLTKGSSAFLQRNLLPGCVTACLEDAIPYVAKDCHIYNSLQKDEAVIILVINFTKKDVSLTAAKDAKTSLMDIPRIHKEHGSSISEEILKDLASKNGDIVISDNQDPDGKGKYDDKS